MERENRAMAMQLLHLSIDRIQTELERVRKADVAERVYLRRRRWFMLGAVAVWLLGVFILGAAFATTSLPLASLFLQLGPLVSTFGPIIIWYVFWVSEGDL